MSQTTFMIKINHFDSYRLKNIIVRSKTHNTAMKVMLANR